MQRAIVPANRKALFTVLLIAGSTASVLTWAGITPVLHKSYEPLAVTKISDLEVANKIQMINSSGPTFTAGAGDPNGSVAAPIGSIRLRTDTAVLYQNTTGAMVWIAFGVGTVGGGPGTPNIVAKWASSTAIADTAYPITDAAGTLTLGNNAADSTVNTGTLTLSPMTLGSVLFAGTAGLVSQDNANLFFDDTNNRLGVGTNGPATFLDVRGSLATTDGIHVRNTTTAGYSSIAFFDTTGTLMGATGFGNSAVADTTVRNRNYWRTLTSDMIFTTSAATPSTAAMMLFNATGNVNIGTAVADPTVKLRVQGAFSTEGNATLGDATTDTHTTNGTMTVVGPTSAVGLVVRTTAQANIRINGDFDNSGADSAYTGLIIARGSTPTELWYVGRDGTTPSDNLVFRRSGTTDDLTINTSGNATFAGNLSVNGNTATGNGVSDALTNTGSFSTTTDQANTATITSTGTGRTAQGISLNIQSTATTFNTTGGALTNFGVNANVTSSRSAGANDLTNTAIRANAANAQVNIAITSDNGNVTLNVASGFTSFGGHWRGNGTALVNGDLSSCGGGTPTAVGTDKAGRITEGTTATGCVLTFKSTWTSAPFCVCSSETNAAGTPVTVSCVATATTLTFTNASASGNVMIFHCFGQSDAT